jgi:hypothetical protein
MLKNYYNCKASYNVYVVVIHQVAYRELLLDIWIRSSSGFSGNGFVLGDRTMIVLSHILGIL